MTEGPATEREELELLHWEWSRTFIFSKKPQQNKQTQINKPTDQHQQTNKQSKTKQNQPVKKAIIHPIARSDLHANPDYRKLQIQAAV